MPCKAIETPGSVSPLEPARAYLPVSLSFWVKCRLWSGRVSCTEGISCPGGRSWTSCAFILTRSHLRCTCRQGMTCARGPLVHCLSLGRTFAPSLRRWAPHCPRHWSQPRECRDERNLVLLPQSSHLTGWARRRAVRPQCEMTVRRRSHHACFLKPRGDSPVDSTV